MKFVLDTNVLIASLFGKKSRKIVDLWKSQHIILCVSQPIIREYQEILPRLGPRGKERLKEVLKLIDEDSSVLVADKTPRLKVVEEDPADDKFIECAVATRADFIISSDKHLKDIKSYKGIKIVTPKEFLDIFSRSADLP